MPRARALKPKYTLKSPSTEVYVGDCRDIMGSLVEEHRGTVDLVFADPPFNWARDYDRHRNNDAWDDKIADEEYLRFTKEWLDLCIELLAPHGSLWVNIPDDWAAEIVVHLKGDRDAEGNDRQRMDMVNWCIWHYRFGQNTMSRFINSKVHALYFCKDKETRVWNPDPVLEASDRATTYGDARTQTKKEGTAGMRVPMDVWYGKWWGRIQGNNSERRPNHDNQIPEVYLERVIRACSNEGDLVMDPFLGSGTTGVVARELGRRFLGCEYTPANAESAFLRIQEGPIRVRWAEPTRHASAIFSPRGSRSR